MVIEGSLCITSLAISLYVNYTTFKRNNVTQMLITGRMFALSIYTHLYHFYYIYMTDCSWLNTCVRAFELIKRITFFHYLNKQTTHAY